MSEKNFPKAAARDTSGFGTFNSLSQMLWGRLSSAKAEGSPMTTTVNQHRNRVRGVLSCCDRALMIGTLPAVCHEVGMTRLLHLRKIGIVDYAEFGDPLRERIRTWPQEFPAQHGAGIGDLRKVLLALARQEYAQDRPVAGFWQMPYY
jgi:hypothetical protein